MLSIEQLNSLKEIDWQNPIKLILINGRQKKVFLKLEEFCNQLTKAIHHLSLEYSKEILVGYPALKLDNIYYLAMPVDEWWPPFFSAIKAIAIGKTELEENDYEALKKITSSLNIKVMVSKASPLCPWAVNFSNQAAIVNRLIKTYIIDIDLYPKMKKHYQITATPTVIINEDYILVKKEVKDIIDWIIKASKKIYDSTVFKSLLKEARAKRVVQLCLEKREIPDALLNLLLDLELPSRIGTMVVLEEISKEAPALIENIIPKLLSMLKLPDKRDRGDILYILGLIGTPEIIPTLEDIASRETEELEGIALEAIENIKNRTLVH
ncbi:MAG: hypothetical protein AMJ45_02760 [Syntrophobacter sp. DG_60]|nr:MAG: hypothetical protein AMJ45_02760 [Syntrophobacter sp. DG_60]